VAAESKNPFSEEDEDAGDQSRDSARGESSRNSHNKTKEEIIALPEWLVELPEDLEVMLNMIIINLGIIISNIHLGLHSPTRVCPGGRPRPQSL